MANKDFFDERLEHIARLIDTTVLNLNKIKDMVIKLDFDEKRDLYRNVEGVSGTFDGVNMVGEDGKKYEIPANYSAKTRIVYGDVLKMIEEDGKHVFKQITKVPRKKVEGVLTRKEGKWHIISDSGTFRVSDVAAEFYNAELNDEAAAFIPEDNLNAPFAALDKVKKAGEAMDNPAKSTVGDRPSSGGSRQPEKKEFKSKASTGTTVPALEVDTTVAIAPPAEAEITPAVEPPVPAVIPPKIESKPQPKPEPKKSPTAPVAVENKPMVNPVRNDRPRDGGRNDRSRGGREDASKNDRSDRGERTDRNDRSRDGGRNDRPARGGDDTRGGDRDRGRGPARPPFRDGGPRAQGQGGGGFSARPPRPKRDFPDTSDDSREATTTITTLDDDDLR